MEIGLLGYATKTGLGAMNRDMWDLGFATHWLAPAHPKLGHDACMLPANAVPCRVAGDTAIYQKFLDKIDALVFVERPVIDRWNIVQEAKRRGILTCCIPMMEWLPYPKDADWVRRVDVMWAVSKWTKQYLQETAREARKQGRHCDWEGQIQGDRWGVNLSRFPFELRTPANRFLFCNGFGGASNRKGIDVVAAAAELIPEVPITVCGQRSNLPSLPPNCYVVIDNVDDPAQLYGYGDVMLAPSRFEGLGLPLYEAQAAGLPVLTTAGEPMNECMPLFEIPVTGTNMVRLHRRSVKAYEADPVRLALMMRRLWQTSIADASTAARQNMVTYFNLEKTLAALRAVLQASQLVRPTQRR